MSLEAVLFDMDGLLLDTERIQIHCWEEKLKSDGISIDTDAFLTTIGGGRREMQFVVEKSYGSNISFEQIMSEKNKLLFKYIEENGIPVKTGAIELLNSHGSFQT